MKKRFVSIWFPHLKANRFARKRPELKSVPFILAAPDHGRMVVAAANAAAEKEGVATGMSVADARTIIGSLEVIDDEPGLVNKLLNALAEWCIRFTPVVAIDEPAGLLLDVTGCAHLWGGEKQYLTDIHKRLTNFGYDIRIAIADTIGTAWATARFGPAAVIAPGKQSEALQPLPPAALRIEPAIAERLEKLGLRNIGSFMNMPRPSLRRRFGSQILLQLDRALGHAEEWLQPVQPPEPFEERLPCMEPILTAKGIEIALTRLLDQLCKRLQQEQKGLRAASFKCYRMDGKIECISIGTHRAAANTQHLFKLFELKIETIEPALGIELFTLTASKTEDLFTVQEKIWENSDAVTDTALAELLDRMEGKIGTGHIHRFLPAEHYWPERSFKSALSMEEKPAEAAMTDRPRPLYILPRPEAVEVTAPIPDYPPMMFRYKGVRHKIIKADGPERIEQEWWLRDGKHRDYYAVEDEEGKRYWLFRAGHYDAEKTYQWFIHGFFA